MFGWEFPPHISGGLGTACYGLTKGFAKLDVDILFVVPRVFGDEDLSAVRLIDAGNVEITKDNFNYKEYMKHITFIEINSNLLPYVSEEEFTRSVKNNDIPGLEITETNTSSKFKFSGKYGKNLMTEVSRYALVAEVIATKQSFDIIHAHDWLTYPAGITAKKASGKPLVIHVHATEFDRSGENINQYVYDIEKMGMEVADKIIAVSNYTRNIIIERYGINPDKVFTVHNAVDFQCTSDEKGEFKKAVNEKIVTFLGRITFQKGPDYFVEAAAKILEKNKNVRFVMAGSGDMMNKMIRRVAKLGISNKFHFAGFLQGDDVNRMFAMSDVYVMPSVSEPFGISPLEAMSSNVPVIISKQSGVAEILTHALKVDFWDIDAIGDSIYGLLCYEGLSKMFAKYGRDEVYNLKWENAAHKVKTIYETLI